MNVLCTISYIKEIKYQTVHFADGQLAISQPEDELQEADFKLIRATVEFTIRIFLKDQYYSVCKSITAQNSDMKTHNVSINQF
jgi:hypothetical protein